MSRGDGLTRHLNAIGATTHVQHHSVSHDPLPRCRSCNQRSVEYAPLRYRRHPITGVKFEVFGIMGERCLNQLCDAYGRVVEIEVSTHRLPPEPTEEEKAAIRAERRGRGRSGPRALPKGRTNFNRHGRAAS